MNTDIFCHNYDSDPHICVEMSGNHQGSLDKALEYVEVAAEKGADSIKVQVYTPDTITLRSDRPDFKVRSDSHWSSYSNLHELYAQAYTPWSWIEKLYIRAREFNIPMFATPFDITAVDFLEELDCPVYKIASPEIVDIPLIEYCAEKGKPIVLSTGMADESILDRAASAVLANGVPLTILKCTSMYPAPVEVSNIACVKWLQDRYSCTVGFSDHTLGMAAASAAVALGGTFIEKHFKLDGDEVSVDSGFSMKLSELPLFKQHLLDVKRSLGKATLDIPEAGLTALKNRRSLYVVKKISAGEEFDCHNVRSIRPGYGLMPYELPSIIGRVAVRDILPGEALVWDMIK